VYLAGYPTLFGSFKGQCRVGTVNFASIGVPATISSNDAATLNVFGNTLNSVIRAAARAAGSWASWVDATPTFSGHGFCDSKAMWFNPLSADVNVVAGTFNADPSRFHPTATGQILGYKKAFTNSGL
jgi:hypothetical protein